MRGGRKRVLWCSAVMAVWFGLALPVCEARPPGFGGVGGATPPNTGGARVNGSQGRFRIEITGPQNGQGSVNRAVIVVTGGS